MYFCAKHTAQHGVRGVVTSAVSAGTPRAELTAEVVRARKLLLGKLHCHGSDGVVDGELFAVLIDPIAT
jgi:hypothetical protein